MAGLPSYVRHQLLTQRLPARKCVRPLPPAVLVMPITLYFLRHGQTASRRVDTFCGSGLDPGLTPEGLEMAHAFTGAYRGKSGQAIYSSKLRRSIQTAQPLSDALGIPL